jgi:hypothetical protein
MRAFLVLGQGDSVVYWVPNGVTALGFKSEIPETARWCALFLDLTSIVLFGLDHNRHRRCCRFLRGFEELHRNPD